MTEFGRSALPLWPLDPAVTYLNHGTVGSTPLRVLAAQQAIRDELERQPAKFLLRELTEVRVGGARTGKPRTREAADAIAPFFGVRGDDLVFVENATTGANAVLRSFPFAAGDEVVHLELGYGGVTNAVRHAARERGATARAIALPDPVRDPAEAVEAFAAALGPKTRLAVIDHITAESALLLPIAALCAECRDRGVKTLVDGAHAPGAIALDMPATGADWYVGNLHKWAWTARPLGILWANEASRQGLHPTVISWGLDQGLTAEFDLLGTRDPTPALSAPVALDLLRELDFERIRRWNHDLAWSAARDLAAHWETEFVTPESMIGTMATIPLPAALGSARPDAARVRDRLLVEHGIEVQVHARNDRLHIRISAQIYNEPADYDRLAHAIDALRA